MPAMFDLNDEDGSITIDFDDTKVVVRPPTTGGYKRLREELAKISRGRDELMKQLEGDEETGPGEMISRLNAYMEDSCLQWWRFVLFGDDQFVPRAEPTPPEDLDTWPLYLMANEPIATALNHWKTVPLARGGTPVPQTS